MRERTNIRLSAADRRALETVAANRNSPQKHVWRARIILMTANGLWRTAVNKRNCRFPSNHLPIGFECQPFGRGWWQSRHRDKAKMERMTQFGHRRDPA
jgi:hypothetical protein